MAEEELRRQVEDVENERDAEADRCKRALLQVERLTDAKRRLEEQLAASIASSITERQVA
jgi:hypothetical protein